MQRTEAAAVAGTEARVVVDEEEVRLRRGHQLRDLRADVGAETAVERATHVGFASVAQLQALEKGWRIGLVAVAHRGLDEDADAQAGTFEPPLHRGDAWRERGGLVDRRIAFGMERTGKGDRVDAGFPREAAEVVRDRVFAAGQERRDVDPAGRVHGQSGR